MTPAAAIARARSAIGHRTAYRLGKGGMNPSSPVPWDASGGCDCSGFIAWVLGISRLSDTPWYKKFNGGWIETTAIVRDARTPFGFFDEVPWEEARPGMIVVYGDDNGHQGHVGMVTRFKRGGGPHRVIHCSSGNYKRTGDAIQETEPTAFTRGHAIIARSAFII